MMNLKQILLSPLCLNCGSFFCDESLFCADCYSGYLSEKMSPKRYVGRAFERDHLYLFEWSKGESDQLSQLVYRLKSNNSVQALQFYAVLLAEKIKKNTEFTTYKGLVPIPSANKKSVHAFILASELSRHLQLPLLDVLQKDQTKDQKTKSLRERQEDSVIGLKFRFSEEFTVTVKPQQKYIFVDDVLTTGESFIQSSRVLGNHDRNVIVSLFYRPKEANRQI